MRKITDIYREYNIMPNLQEHMLRVASVASLICDNFTDPVSKKDIVTACLFHDMGNIIKFQLDYFPDNLEPKGLEYWQNVQKEFIKKYGGEEHLATSAILKEIGIPKKIIKVVENNGFRKAPVAFLGDDFRPKISTYSDMRVMPDGVTSLERRLDDLAKRYGKKSPLNNEEVVKIHSCLYKIEEQIFARCRIKPEDINNQTVEPIIKELRDFVLK